MKEKTKLLNCWEHFKCEQTRCSAYKSKDSRCWLHCETYCYNSTQETWLEKIGICINCELFERKHQPEDFKETLLLFNNQFMEYKKGIQEKTEQLEKKKVNLSDLKNTCNVLLKECERDSVSCSYLLSECHRESTELLEIRKKLERRVEEKTKKLREIQMQLLHSTKMAAIGRFSAGIAHEINNPLAGVLNCIRTLLDDSEIIDQKREYLELTLEGLLRIENTIGQILSFSSHQEFKPRLTDINQVLQEALAFTKLRLIEKKIIIKENLVESLPLIMVDPFQIQQVFMNIIGNAIDALSSEGNIYISTTVKNGKIAIIFNDTGIGIKAKDLEKVFDPFYTTKEVGEGTGLGLSISYNIIKQHQGIIDIKSKESKGTTVTITLPILKKKNVSEKNINS